MKRVLILFLILLSLISVKCQGITEVGDTNEFINLFNGGDIEITKDYFVDPYQLMGHYITNFKSLYSNNECERPNIYINCGIGRRCQLFGNLYNKKIENLRFILQVDKSVALNGIMGYLKYVEQ